jgi:hypothetical protein
MAAKKKSASRRSAAKTKSKTAKPRPKAKKAAKKVAKKKAAKKKVAVRKKPAPTAKRPARPARRAAAPSAAVVEIDRRIAIVRNNLRDLTEQGSGASGGGSEELLSDRIAREEAELQRLLTERDALA